MILGNEGDYRCALRYPQPLFRPSEFLARAYPSYPALFGSKRDFFFEFGLLFRRIFSAREMLVVLIITGQLQVASILKIRSVIGVPPPGERYANKHTRGDYG